MANKFATIVIALILLLVVFFAFQNFYKPPATQAADQLQQDSLEPVNLQLASSWPIPATNLTFTHNVSIVEGKRADIATFYNPDKISKRVSLLVFVPKKIARNVGEISSSRPLQVINEDPCGFIELDLPPGTTQFAATYAVLVTSPTGGAVMLPLAAASRENIEQLCNALGEAGDYIEGLTPTQVMDFALGLTVSPASLVAGGLRQLAAQEQQIPVELEPVYLEVNELSLARKTSFDLLQVPRGTLLTRVVESDDTGLGRFIRVWRDPDVDERRVHVRVDLSNYEMNGAKLPDRKRVEIRLRDSSNLDQPETVVPLRINFLEKHFDGITITPVRFPDRRGGELLFVVNNLKHDLPIEIESTTGLGNYSISTILPSGQLNAKATVIYIDNERLKLSGLTLKQNGVEIERTRASVTEEYGPDQLEPFYSIVSPADSADCSAKFCACGEAQIYLRNKVRKVTEEFDYYAPPVREGERFCESFIFSVADTANCDFGVNFEPRAKPKPSAVNVIQICTLIVKADNAPDLLSSDDITVYASQDFEAASVAQTFTPTQVIQAAKQQFLCHDPAGLPSSRPDGFCSRDTRIS